jgi:hypothetical protein
MITFKTQINVLFPNREKGPFNPISLKSLDWSVTYDNTAKIASVLFRGIGRALTIWEGADYDKAGQFNDNDVQARVIEILGIKSTDIA